ncbi:esterase-like activity of phytase family protein [Dyadobacter luticola]|uniref:Esterase-like activity of phytase family protein n=1 Tax=Dyadobacter luticola TaxID=1979387 RepID=A0A5R9L4K4_9BACT|nr:esterase-like activity of phytase family protein [Dyadobacter luticola]TLV03341.1 esterase-like activity of phytase family protein [Dyadobacter luticola]
MKTFLLAGLTLTAASALLLSGCTDHEVPSDSYPARAEASNPAVMAQVGNVTVYNGGFGSALVQDPHDKNAFYLLTDRGSNIDGAEANVKVFSSPEFVPQIGKFRLIGDQLVLEKTIYLKNASGQNLNGLPNPTGFGFSGEIAKDVTGNVLPNSVDGIDSEGLTMAADGTFWVSDEYGPHIVHFDANGNTIERINPFGNGTGGRKIPMVFAKRRPNRGMEGLAITPDGKTLVGMMQFPLYNPSSAAIAGSMVTRILAFDIASGTSKEYVYLIDKANLQANSEIVAINNTQFLVIERDGEYATDATRGSVFKKVFKIDISGATDISDPANGENGKLYGGKTVEELKDMAGLAANGIMPVTKTLAADLMTDISTLYPHDKAEGICIIDANTIAISNDDDFGVVTKAGQLGTYDTKILPATGKVDRNTIYFVKLKQPLW